MLARKTLVFFLLFAFLLPGCGKKEEQASEGLGSTKNQIFVSGSASVIPLLKMLAESFSERDPNIEMVFLPDSHSKGGIAGTAEAHYDIGAVSREMHPDERENPLQYLHLAIDGMVFVTHPGLRIRNLTPDQIRGIYSGRIVNWADVGGPNAKIEIIDRPEHTSAKIALRQVLLGGDFRITDEAVVVERPWQVTDSVTLIPHSIGYTSLGEIISSNPDVNMVSINGVEPTPLNIKNGQYKFLRPFGLVLGDSPKASTMRFINLIFSETGSKIMENAGYVPLRYEIVIGIVPEQNPMVQIQRYKPLADYLSHRLGEKFSVRPQLFPTYIEVCRSLARGDINAAFLGSLGYATVREYVDVIARPDYDGVSTYKGMLFVRADSSIKSLHQMAGKRLVMGGKTTTAGYVFPLYYFKKNGIENYRKYFAESNFVGTHEDAILAVLHNRADVGAAKDLIFNMITRDAPSLQSSIRILAESPPVPSNAFVIRKDVSLPCFDCHRKMGLSGAGESLEADMNISGAIREYLLEMPENPEGQRALMMLGNATRFVETKDSDYSELYEMLEKINLRPEDLLSRN